MRIALLLSGLPRCWRECLPTQLAMAPGHQVDVFFHFWNPADAPERDDIRTLLRPRQHSFQDPVDFGFADALPDLKRDNITVPSRLVAQYYSWCMVGMLFRPFALEYDLVVRSRSDLQFLGTVEDWIGRVGPGRIGFTWFAENQALSDAFAIGDPNPVMWLHCMYDNMWLYRSQVVFNAEVLLHHHLQRYPAPLEVGAFEAGRFFVRRPHMEGWSTEQCLAEPMGVSKWRDPEVLRAHKEYFARQYGMEGLAHVDRFAASQLTHNQN